MVSVSGRPAPVITWSKQGVDLVSRGIIDTTDSYTLLIVDKVNRYDAGKYIIEAENQSGKKSATISVKVYGKYCYNCIISGAVLVYKSNPSIFILCSSSH